MYAVGTYTLLYPVVEGYCLGLEKPRNPNEYYENGNTLRYGGSFIEETVEKKKTRLKELESIKDSKRYFKSDIRKARTAVTELKTLFDEYRQAVDDVRKYRPAVPDVLQNPQANDEGKAVDAEQRKLALLRRDEALQAVNEAGRAADAAMNTLAKVIESVEQMKGKVYRYSPQLLKSSNGPQLLGEDEEEVEARGEADGDGDGDGEGEGEGETVFTGVTRKEALRQSEHLGTIFMYAKKQPKTVNPWAPEGGEEEQEGEEEGEEEEKQEVGEEEEEEEEEEDDDEQYD